MLALSDSKTFVSASEKGARAANPLPSLSSRDQKSKVRPVVAALMVAPPIVLLNWSRLHT